MITLIAMTPIGNLVNVRPFSLAMGITAILFSFSALIGCWLIRKQKEIVSCFLLLISAVGGIISMSYYFVAPAFLLITAGIMTIMSPNEEAQKVK